ncbi:MAG: hypothetical protein H6728_07840 [Myxococcales bacterium]|nr:hypothetical protein [Myxococcales bacterium]
MMKKKRYGWLFLAFVSFSSGIGLNASACQCAGVPLAESALPDGSAGKETTLAEKQTENKQEPQAEPPQDAAPQEPILPDQKAPEKTNEPVTPEKIAETTPKPDEGIDFPKTWPTDVTTPKPASNRTFESTHFSGAENCSTCHNGLQDNKGEDVSIVHSWSASMMALASRDPFWQAKVESELIRHPQLKSVINEKCTRCHAPMANHESKVQKKDIVFSETGGGILDPANPLFHHARAGVSCTLCHQIKPTAEMGTLAGFSGKYQIETFADKVDRKIYGPYMDPFTGPMMNMVSFTPTGSAHISSSKLCGSCHNLKTPYVDSQGKVIPQKPEDEFPEQMIYSEWEHSAYNDKGAQPTSCQNCHMPATQDVKVSTRPPWLDARSKFSKHIFVGANLFMLTMMKSNQQLLGIGASNDHFDFTLHHAKQKLESAAKLEVLENTRQGTSLKIKLRVNNFSGHKLPSGFPSRRVYLHFKVSDAQGKVLFESGKMGAHGLLEGADADFDAQRVEPHHNEITKPDQVQIYEAIMQDTDKKPTYALLRGAAYAKDNRLLPKGFDKNTASSDIKVHGAAAQDADFTGGSDVITYNLSGMPSSGKLKVEANLMYQTLSYRFAKDLFQDRQSKAVMLFMYLYQQAPAYAYPINQLTQEVP